jgi:hypothetical protein
MQVEALDLEDAAKCIFRYIGRNETDTEEFDLACELADHVGRLPLALATIGGYVKQSQCSLSDFFEDIMHKSTLWEKAEKIKEAQAYEWSLRSVFVKAFEDLSPSAQELLDILAFCDPDSVPEDIFLHAVEDGNFGCIRSKSELTECYFELRSRQLIVLKRDSSSKHKYVSVHRMVQWNVLLELSKYPSRRWESFSRAFKIVRAMLPSVNPKAVPEPDIWPLYIEHGRQILELRKHCLWPKPPIELPVEFAKVLSEMGTYMWFSGKFREGKRALARSTADDILVRSIDPSDAASDAETPSTRIRRLN